MREFVLILVCLLPAALVWTASYINRGEDDEDPFVAQARKDQKRAAYPGCRLGYLCCLSQTCGCNEWRPSKQFVTARARMLREEPEALAQREGRSL